MSSWACFIAACVIYPSCMMFAAIAEVTDLRRGFIESSFRDLCTVAIACLAISTCHNLRRLTNKLRCPLSKANRRHNHVHGSNSTRVRARLCDGSNAPANSRSARFALFLRDGSLPRCEAGSAFALHDVDSFALRSPHSPFLKEPIHRGRRRLASSSAPIATGWSEMYRVGLYLSH